VVTMRRALKIVVEAFWGLVTVFILMGGIISGIFTPTESAAVACIYAFVITMFVYRDYKWRDLPLLIGRVVRTVGMVMIMIGFSGAFGYMMVQLQLAQKATDFFVSVSENKYVFLLLVNIMLLLLGTFMDLAPMLLICTPIFLPAIKYFGVDPVHFGMIMILNLGIGLLTPPVGPTLVVGCAIGKVTMEAVSKSILIFYVPMLIVLLLVTYIPAISLFLPRLFGL
jgi:tripartite ATP-independent transporter DctM subunit